MRSDRPMAVVTGAARGIGRGCAIDLARHGFDLVVDDRDGVEERTLLESLVRELAAAGARATIVQADVADLAAHRRLVDAALADGGRLDCLVNNAGVGAMKRGDLLEVTPESFDRCIAINTRAVFFLCQTVARHFLAQGEIDGRHRSIINITSSNASAVSVSRGEYGVSKAASHMTTKLFAVRLAEAGIGVYEIRPGLIETEMTRPVKARYDGMVADGSVPMRRWGRPEDVASTVCCMAEGRLRYTVGQVVSIDGGLTHVTF